MLTSAAFAVLALASAVFADPAPLTPQTTNEGSTCTISWTPDTTGEWKETSIQLMTGDNFQMKHITTIAKVDTTSAAPSTYTYPCPAVDPNSAIYFYQFSTPTAPTKLVWSTRFAIADSTGKTTPPQFPTQPDATNSPIPWGIGNLEDPSKATPPPSYITGQGTVTGSSSASVSASVSGSSSVTGSSSGTISRIMTSSGSGSSVRPTGTVSSSSQASTARSTTSASSSPNAALSQSQSSLVMIALGSVFAGLLGMA